MFRVLREDCDGSVDVFCPANTGGSVPEREEKIYNKLIENLSARNPHKWMSCAINAIPYGPKCNIQNLQDIKDDLALKHLPFGFYAAINAADRDDVSNKLLMTHLQMIASNLEYLDKYDSLRPVVAARCTPLHLVALHCKLDEIFLLKTLRHRKIPKVESNFRDLFVYFCRLFFRCLWALVTSRCSVEITLIINELQTLSRNRVDNCAILL